MWWDRRTDEQTRHIILIDTLTDAADLSADDVETAVWASLELLMAHEVGAADELDDLTSGDVIDTLTFFLLWKMGIHFASK